MIHDPKAETPAYTQLKALEARLKRAEELLEEAVGVHNRQKWIQQAQSFLAENGK